MVEGSWLLIKVRLKNFSFYITHSMQYERKIRTDFGNNNENKSEKFRSVVNFFMAKSRL